ncbi:MAG: hypothetical protein CMF74_09395 [Maricaulis sp.]|jgi:hypothetical protein|nr:hypothetical protein [Maricaulis sp.]HAQ34359.1 DUF3035 domain-containing protein [Alphaproteobacteria bacterium]
MRQRAILASLAVAAIAVTGCQNVRQALGSEKVTPDEFRVVTIAPLTVPPEYNLRPPRPGSPRPEEIYPDQAARAALMGQQGTFDGSDGETLLVARAGAGEADPFIREIVDGETGAVVRKTRSFTDQILFWQGNDTAYRDAETPIDAEEEAARLAEQQARADAVTGGRPVQIERDRGGLGKLPGL